MTVESEDFYKALSPKIRRLVRLLHEWGYGTSDSGDGTNLAEGMECALPFPMVAIVLDDDDQRGLEFAADELHERFEDAGWPIGEDGQHGLRKIEASYEPGGPRILLVLNMNDDDSPDTVV